MEERLQKLISAAGLMSRRAAEEAIQAGRIQVNGIPATLGDKADPDFDQILVDGVPLANREEKLYIMLYKPRGYVTTLSDEKGRKIVTDLLEGLETRVYPVGRLDLDSEGLLLLTNDGDFANRLMHPKHEVEKCYHAWVRGEQIQEKTDELRKPMILDGTPIRPAKVRILKASEQGCLLEIVIHEGRNRQVRKMCAQIGLNVTRLKRVREGSLCIGDLRPGQWRYLTQEEKKNLYESEH